MKIKTLSDLIAWNISNYTIAFKVIYVDITDDLIAGLLLSQIMYWHLPNKNGYSKLRVEKDDRFWIAKTRSEWYSEIRISERQFDRASKILAKDDDGNGLGIIDMKVYKFAGTPMWHIALNHDILFELLNKQINKYSNKYNTSIPQIIKTPKKKPEEIPYRKFKHLLLSKDDYEKLNELYTQQQIDDILDRIENHKNNIKYVSLYLTARTWLRKEHERKKYDREGY